MNISAFINDLFARGVALWPDGTDLGLRGPKETLTPDVLTTLKAHKEEILQALQHGSESFPLTHGQWVFWFEEQMAAAQTTYNVSLAIRIRAPLDPSAMQRALQMLVNRHPMLRTTFAEQDGTPVQHVHQYQAVTFRLLDRRGQAWESIHREVMATHAEPFDLVQGPLFRATLFQQTATEYVLICCMHHIICDGISSWIILDELPVLYAIATTGQGTALPPHKAHFADYVSWQQELLAREGETLLAFWRQKLQGAPTTLALPTDFPRPTTRTYTGASQLFALSSQLTKQLHELARKEEVTLYMLLLAAYQILLYRYTGQEDLLVESRMAGRPNARFFALVGNFFSPVVMRGELGGNPTFRDYLQQVRRTTLETLEHQSYPFLRLVEQLAIARDPARSPLVQVSFGLNQPLQQTKQWRPHASATFSEPEGMLGDWPVKLLKTNVLEGMYELDLEMIEMDNRLVGALNYNTSLFAAATATRMIANLERLLMAIVQAPATPIRDLPLLAAAERQQLLVDWNATATAPLHAGCIYTRFEEQAARTPDAPALIIADNEGAEPIANSQQPIPNLQSLTYRQLNERANQLAHYLRSLGVGPGALVGIAIPHAAEMVVGLLAILKAGGAYVPLDPAYPRERLQQMIDEAGMTILLTREALRSQLPTRNQTILALDALANEVNGLSIENPTALAQPTDLIYTIFTSGSTGKPKGAGVYHRGFANLLDWYIDDLGLSAADRLLLVTSLSFDLTQKNIFAPLLTGGALYLAAQPFFDPGALCRVIERHAISWINCTPSILYHLLDAEHEQTGTALASLRTVVLGGEPIYRERLQSWLRQPGRAVRLFNSYGPTECTDVCAAHLLDLQQEDAAAIPLGRPIRNVQLYVLDEDQQPVPLGAHGELYIGGVGIGAGYRNDPALTAARFHANPLSASPTSQQLYRTGDAVKYLPDGNLLFLGRVDNQVKVRGMRVELGEIESALGQHPLVQQAVVTLHQPRPNEERLVAYVVPQPGLGLSTTGSDAASLLRAYLSNQLPPHMVPATFLLLTKLPLTPSGKVDRNALPIPDEQSEAVVTQGDGGARTPLEQEIAALWAAELGLPTVDIHARLFALGGDSFTAVRLIAKLKEAGFTLALRDFMEEPTVANIAKHLAASRGLADAPAHLAPATRRAQQVPPPRAPQPAPLAARPQPRPGVWTPSETTGAPTDRVAPLTGDEYLATLRDGREVWIYGERVADVTMHPAFHNQARMVARLYDALHEPAQRSTLLGPADLAGECMTHPYFRASYTPAELLASRAALVAWLRIGYGWMGRGPDYMAGLLGMLGPNADLYAPFDGNARRMYVDFQQRMPYVNHAFVNPPVDRDRPPDEVGDVYVHVVRETDAGLIVSGAKNITTNAALTNYSFVAHDGGAPVRDRAFAATFLLPMNSAGLKIICRPSYEMMATTFASPFDYPLSGRFDENDAILICDEVLVPWENVLIYGDLEKHNKHIHNTGFHPRAGLQSATRMAVKLDLITGLLLKATEATGVAHFRGVQAQVGEVLTWRHLFWALSDAMAHNAVLHRGALIPKAEHMMAHRLMMTTAYPRVRELIAQLVASGLIFHPSSARDFQSPELRPYLDKYMRGSNNTAAVERTKLMKTLWDAVGTEFGGRHELYERNNMGSHEAIRLSSLFQGLADGTQDALKAFAESCMAEVDLDGWTAPDLRNGQSRSQPAPAPFVNGAGKVAFNGSNEAPPDTPIASPPTGQESQPIDNFGNWAPPVAIEPDLGHRYDPFPLTEIQAAYYLGRGDTFALGGVTTHIYFELEVAQLDVARFNQAWQRLIERHEMLRAVVRTDGQQQILAETPPYAVELLDLSQQDPAGIDETLLRIRNELSHQVLPAEQWPIFDLRATKTGADRIRLHFSLDCLMLDAWSIQLLLRELVLFYQYPAVTLPPLTLSFRDYVLAEKALAETTAYQADWAYWQQRLDTLPPGPELPLACDPAQIRRSHFVRRAAVLSASEWAQLKTRARQAELTPSGLLLAAFAEVLATWSKTDHFTLNLTLFNRLPLHPEVNNIVGDFTPVLLLEVTGHNQPSFMQRAQALQRQLWDDMSHNGVNGVRVLREWARQHNDTTRSGIMPIVFTSMLAMATESAEDASFGELVYAISQTPQVWLDHQVIEQQGALHFNWDAVEELFPAGLLDAMFSAYCELLRRLATEDVLWHNPHLCLTPAAQLTERDRVNATAAPVSAELLHTLFLQQAARTPDAVAVITPSRQLTYGAVRSYANQIAHWLRAHGVDGQQTGVRTTQLVAVVMEKGWEQVVAVLGIHLAGAAYLPIEPQLPAERQQYLLAQGETALALTQSHLAAQLSWPAGIQPLAVDTLTVDPRLPLLPGSGQPTDLAYVIYTSGSTGLPKGVVIDHRGAVNTVLDINRRFSVTAADRVLALSALNFDLSVYDIFGLLAVGGAIVIPAADRRIDPDHWIELIEQHGVTLWDTVPALMQMLVETVDSRGGDRETGRQGGTQSGSALRLVMLSGDWIPVTLPERIKALWAGIKVYGLGGATEASIWSIFYPIEEVDPAWPSIPYGKPLTNQSFQVLDTTLKPCPVWTPGNLYIGGLGLALGYWRDEEKSNASFITHPRSGERLYKTGDLGRYLPGGEIEFLGREDFQVKIRGHRIELGEIESALLQHPAVNEAVVSAVGDPKGHRHLVAYVVLDATASLPPQTNATRPEQRGTNHRGELGAPDGYIAQAFQNDDTPGFLTDPLARLEFQLSQPGLRSFNGKGISHPTIDSQVNGHDTDYSNGSSNGLPAIQLTSVEFDETRRAAWLARQSYRTFTDTPIAFADFSEFLSCLTQMPVANTALPKYRYPSAGNLYPLQSYFYLKPDRIAGCAGGFYYYHPARHCLLPLTAHGDDIATIAAGPNGAILAQAAFMLFLVADMNAITPMYGALARDFALLEAGAMSQLLMTQAAQHTLGLCPIGEVDSAVLQQALALGDQHQILHTLAGGPVDPIQRTQWPHGSQPATTPTTALSWQTALQHYLHEKLPDYMVPTSFVALPALPLTPNGKVDRKALPVPDLALRQTATFTAPNTTTEQLLANLWAELLGLERVGIHDDFFTLGGDSLTATQLKSRLHEATQLDLPLRILFEHNTIHSLAAEIDAYQIIYAMETTTQPETERNVAVTFTGESTTENAGDGAEEEEATW